MTLTVTFDLYLENLTLVITFELFQVGPLYFTCVFLMARPFNWYQTFDLVTLTVIFDLYLKKIDFVITFEQ